MLWTADDHVPAVLVPDGFDAGAFQLDRRARLRPRSLPAPDIVAATEGRWQLSGRHQTALNVRS